MSVQVVGAAAPEASAINWSRALDIEAVARCLRADIAVSIPRYYDLGVHNFASRGLDAVEDVIELGGRRVGAAARPLAWATA